MCYARWSSEQELKKVTTPVSVHSKIEKSGLPMGYDQTNLFINTSESHSLIIGASGSGKTQSIMLPMLKMSIMAGESFLIHDVKGELYRQFSSTLKENGYQLVLLDFQDKKYGNYWNPLMLPYELYQSGEKDDALELLNSLAYYLLYDDTYKGSNNDPFWENTCRDYFVGLAIYLFEHAKKDEINLNSIFNLSSETVYLKNEITKLPKTSKIYLNLASTVLASPETKGSILAVFNQKVKSYIVSDKLSQMLSLTNFDLHNISNQKTAIFVIGGHKNETYHLFPLFVDQLFYLIQSDHNIQNKKFFNIMLDEFESLMPIRNFTFLLNDARRDNIRFILFVNSLTSLTQTYGKEDAEMIKFFVGNIVYLFSNDFNTLQEISHLCGNRWDETKNREVPLIGLEELKTLSSFESVMLIPRYMPFRLKLLPDYVTPWPVTFLGEDPNLRQNVEISIYKVQS